MSQASLNGEERRFTDSSDYPRSVLLRAEAKRSLKGALAVTSKDQVSGVETGKAASFQVPSSDLPSKAALARLLKVPEFFLQLERVPAKKGEEKMETEVADE